MTKTCYEIIEWCSKGKTRKDKIARLQKNSGPVLKTILGYTFDPNVKWLLPEGLEVHGALTSELRRLYLFVEGPTETQQKLKSQRREALFIELLESVHPEDAKLLLSMKERKLPVKGITRKLVAEAFPNLSKDW
jgi:hypothetical protein